jgi:hyperosmotically inducible protein
MVLFTGLVSVAALPTDATGAQADRPSQARTADEWVTTQIQAKYFLDPAIKQRSVDVTTINGVVTLAGEVGSQQERERASDIAARVSGVRNVENRLSVTGEAPATGTSGESGPPPGDRPPGSDEIERVTHSDPVILSQIKAKYAIDPDVSAVGIDVDVEGGNVTLTGDVASAAVKHRAETLARSVPGVKNVKNGLKVKS